MFIPGLLVQLLQRRRSGVLGEEVRVESVLGLVVRLHLAERYQVTGRWKFTLFIGRLQHGRSMMEGGNFLLVIQFTRSDFGVS